jgi:hypothetical protein
MPMSSYDNYFAAFDIDQLLGQPNTFPVMVLSV